MLLTNKEIMIKAHKMTKELKEEFPQVNYQFQLSICIKFLKNKFNQLLVVSSEKVNKTKKEFKKYLGKIKPKKVSENKILSVLLITNIITVLANYLVENMDKYMNTIIEGMALLLLMIIIAMVVLFTTKHLEKLV